MSRLEAMANGRPCVVTDVGENRRVLAGTGSMAAAAILLFVTSPDKRGAALKQGIVPLLAAAALVIGSLA